MTNYNVFAGFKYNSHPIRRNPQNKLDKKFRDLTRDAYQSGTLTITLECFLYLCEAVIESYLCVGDPV